MFKNAIPKLNLEKFEHALNPKKPACRLWIFEKDDSQTQTQKHKTWKYGCLYIELYNSKKQCKNINHASTDSWKIKRRMCD